MAYKTEKKHCIDTVISKATQNTTQMANVSH